MRGHRGQCGNARLMMGTSLSVFFNSARAHTTHTRSQTRTGTHTFTRTHLHTYTHMCNTQAHTHECIHWTYIHMYVHPNNTYSHSVHIHIHVRVPPDLTHAHTPTNMHTKKCADRFTHACLYSWPFISVNFALRTAD